MSAARHKVESSLPRLKVFPLPSVVLFPGTSVPLHVFEPRYRALVTEALAGDGVIAMARFEPGWEADYAGRPPLKHLVCAGVIESHQALEDGRFNIVLQGVARVRVLRELSTDKPYREVEGAWVHEQAGEGLEEAGARQAVMTLLPHLSDEGAQHLGGLVRGVHGSVLADVLASNLAADAAVRERLFEQLDVGARFADVTGLLLDIGARLTRDKPAQGLLN